MSNFLVEVYKIVIRILNIIPAPSFNLLASNTEVNWCNIPGCTPNSQVACNNNGMFASTCVKPQLFNFTQSQIQRLVNEHNSNRSLVASGKFRIFPPAKRMAQLQWNNELAWLASFNVKKCKMQHDTCTNTNDFKYVGQNLASISTTKSYSVEQVIDQSIKMWFNENINVQASDINKLSLNTKTTVFHFTEMMQERITQFGCAISTSVINGMNFYFVACNYDSTNLMGCSVYRSGPVASGCIQGPDPTYPGLCKITENINPNTFVCT